MGEVWPVFPPLRGVPSIKHLRAYFGQRFAAGEREQLVRRKLIGSLYAQPTSLAMGALAGIVTAGAAAYETGTLLLDALGLALVFVAVVRVLVAAWLSRHLEDDTRDTRLPSIR